MDEHAARLQDMLRCERTKVSCACVTEMVEYAMCFSLKLLFPPF